MSFHSPKLNSKYGGVPSGWSIDSWRQCPISQQPNYEDESTVKCAIEKIKQLPPLVNHLEIETLKEQLADAGKGKRFVVQGGDCAERFVDCSMASIEAKLKILLQMSLVLVWGARIPTVRIGRVAGQYGKPRSSPTEIVDGKEILSYKGDNINRFEATEEGRRHDPARLVEAHFHSACTLNYIRALLKGGFADLHQAYHWDLGYVRDLQQRDKYKDITTSIVDALDFMQVCGMSQADYVGTIDYFTSHEGLVLEYEAAMTQLCDDRYYNLGAHMVWIGDRTRQLDSAHVEYFRGIANPVGVKVGPSMKPDELVELVRKINPFHEPGRVTLITRFGHSKVKDMLPPLIRAVQQARLCVTWICDPMHGNTHKTDDGIKTRSFDAIMNEVISTFEVHVECDSCLGGVHFELTGENVTECTGGPEKLSAEDLRTNYTTHCDPRLNYAQSMEVSFRLAQLLQRARVRESDD